ncbi:MAG: DsrH/TusB family sulfur relay protein [Chloroflexi bacterium]|nr:DsrH/TusB family sulfur relay protein [Chloroflexota bacterium]MDA8187461.1 DsrH/TusB family sulfur metabolism protein [Dehalococcoidales bacterium]
MANLYLLGAPAGRNGLALAERDEAAAVVLIQDGVYLDVKCLAGKKVYAVRKDVEKRGLASRLPGSVELIDYGKLVDLVLENKVINFA